MKTVLKTTIFYKIIFFFLTVVLSAHLYAQSQGDENKLETTDMILLKDNKYATFESNLFWRINDPILYFKKLGDYRRAEIRLKDIYSARLSYIIAINRIENESKIIDDENLKRDLLKDCNDTIKKFEFGIEIIKVEIISILLIK
jgi:regulator of protease activity HflC (stomatin/prohibitin superfamily)